MLFPLTAYNADKAAYEVIYYDNYIMFNQKSTTLFLYENFYAYDKYLYNIPAAAANSFYCPVYCMKGTKYDFETYLRTIKNFRIQREEQDGESYFYIERNNEIYMITYMGKYDSAKNYSEYSIYKSYASIYGTGERTYFIFPFSLLYGAKINIIKTNEYGLNFDFDFLSDFYSLIPSAIVDKAAGTIKAEAYYDGKNYERILQGYITFFRTEENKTDIAFTEIST